MQLPSKNVSKFTLSDSTKIVNAKLSPVLPHDDPLNSRKFNFTNFNNETGADRMIIPNIIHYVRLNMTEYSLVEYLCVKAALRHHRPDYFYIHTDVGDSFTGKYWNKIKSEHDLWSRIRILPTQFPKEIYGKKLSLKWLSWHASDIVRLRVMMKYGGMYLDSDIFVVQNLDK